MFISTLEAAVALNFTLPEVELKQTGRILRANSQNFTSSRMNVTLSDGQAKSNGKAREHSYKARFEYNPPVRLEHSRVERELYNAESSTDLDFRKGRGVFVTRAGLPIFKTWHYSKEIIPYQGDFPGQSYSAELSFIGTVSGLLPRMKLKELCDVMKLSDRYETIPEFKIKPQDYAVLPQVHLKKTFNGDFTPEAESQIVNLYNSVQEVALFYEMAEKAELAGFPLAEFGKRFGVDIRNDFASSTPARNSRFGPALHLTIYQPLHRSDRQVGSKIETVAETMVLKYVDPGRKADRSAL